MDRNYTQQKAPFISVSLNYHSKIKSQTNFLLFALQNQWLNVTKKHVGQYNIDIYIFSFYMYVS